MRKLSLIFAAVMIAALAGCAGDTSGTGGDLAKVEDFQLDASSTGRTIVLVWSAVDDVDGYKVSFRNDATGTYTELDETTTTTFTHTANNAGDYVVIAYKGDDTSSENSIAVSTMPTVVSGTYTIVDNNADPNMPSGFRFGSSSGTTGMASDPSFLQDIYAYDDDFKGDTNVSLYSGNKGSFGNGVQSYFQEPAGNGYCDPAGTWFNTSYPLYSGDSVVFVNLTDGSDNTNGYAKMFGLSVVGSSTEHGTEVTFSYEIQVAQQGAGFLTVFTSNAN